MEIRKSFEFNNSHIVRNCSSDRCKYSIHAHTYQVEVFLESFCLDNGQMILDFGLLKGPVKDFIKAFDNSYTMWEKEPEEFQLAIKQGYSRVVTTKFSPSAEMFSKMFFVWIKRIIDKTKFANGEVGISLSKVRVHETTTGYAEYTLEEFFNSLAPEVMVEFSSEITNGCRNLDPLLLRNLSNSADNSPIFINEEVEQQI